MATLIGSILIGLGSSLAAAMIARRYAHHPRIVVALASIAFCGAAMVTFAIAGSREKTHSFAIPDLSGLSVDQAEHVARKLGLEFEVVGGKTSTYPRDTVVTQDPAPATLAEGGGSVRVTLSDGLVSRGTELATAPGAGQSPLPTSAGGERALKLRGRIVQPKTGSTVGAAFPANGSIELGPSEVGWLAVRIGNMYRPKEPAITQSGAWERMVFEGGPPGTAFSLALIVVDRDTNEQILTWFDQARRTGNYPGMPLATQSTLLDEIDLHLAP